MREPGVKNTPEAITKALEGDYRQEHLFALKQAVKLSDFSHRQREAATVRSNATFVRLRSKSILSLPSPLCETEGKEADRKSTIR